MKLSISCCGLILGLMLCAAGAQAGEPQLAHIVYFTLNEDTEETRSQLVTACQKYLSGNEGTVYFAVGTRAEELARDVNDLEFDVSLHIVFENDAAHEKYQTHPRHLEFIAENKDLWGQVRVFDSHLARRAGLPQGAAKFAGMVRGKVVSKGDHRIVLAVEQVLRVWKTSRADDPQALVGASVPVDGSRSDLLARFVDSLEVGQSVALDVAHREGQSLTILELTEEQRQRAGQ